MVQRISVPPGKPICGLAPLARTPRWSNLRTIAALMVQRTVRNQLVETKASYVVTIVATTEHIMLGHVNCEG